MQVFAYDKAHALENFAIHEQTASTPDLQPKDILVRVKAFSINPVDYKIRQSRSAKDKPVILGWDAAGIVEAVGPEVQGFRQGDEIYYAGDLNRDGSYSALQAVDYRLVAHKPAHFSFEDAAALPLTTLTAYEALLERNIEYTSDSKVLIIGGAGGVGSMAIQLLKALTPATVIATSTRPETIAWTKQMGADHVIGRDLKKELAGIGIEAVDVVFSTTHTESYLGIIPELLHPFGHMMLIDDPETLDIAAFKPKALSVHWELMFSKSLFGYRMETQGAILRTVAGLADAGKIKTTRQHTFAASAESLQQAHRILEEGKSFGKIVIKGLGK